MDATGQFRGSRQLELVEYPPESSANGVDIQPLRVVQEPFGIDLRPDPSEQSHHFGYSTYVPWQVKTVQDGALGITNPDRVTSDPVLLSTPGQPVRA